MKSNNLFRVTVFACWLGVLSGCGHDGNEKEKSKPLIFQETLQGIVVSPSTVPLYYEAVGTIRAKTKAVLSSKISGQVKQVNVM